ncbi:MAG: SCO1664 family protein [Anaerolineae bacterium]|nr:SCO1664 family protein [Anaerolineae bacterium]MDW8069936.1 SCO1664 family protein [Anaerolineae bacterium]
MAANASTEQGLEMHSPSGGEQADAPRVLSLHQVLEVLQSGTMYAVHGLIPWSSNYTFLVTVQHQETKLLAVYKPIQGERPLWDFPHGSLAQREVAAFLVSMALGWHLVPPTVLREGVYGPGAVQLFIEHDFEEHYFTLRERPPEVFTRIVAFDVITNNADRKAGHILRDRTGRIWVVDHGLTFHVQPKLRTVLWDFADQPLPHDMQEDLQQLLKVLRDPESALVTQLAQLINLSELAAFRERVAQLLRVGRFPLPSTNRRCVPFPLV